MDPQQKTLWLIQSQSLNPFYNIALERLFMEDKNLDQNLLLIYRNRPSVIIGKNQNPWTETIPDYLDSQGTDLVRRYSGGGTVYHDPGNLNLSLILPSDAGRKEQLFKLVQTILSKAGLNQTQVLGNSLYYKQKKISGSAYYYKKNRALLHCTLLIAADLKALSKSIKADTDLKIISRAVESVRAKVANCCDFNPELNIKKIMEIIQNLSRVGDYSIQKKKLHFDSLTENKLKEFIAELQSWDWQFGRTPPFECRLNLDKLDGNTKKSPIYIKINSGFIEQISINDDIKSKISNYNSLINLKSRIFNPAEIKAMI